MVRTHSPGWKSRTFPGLFQDLLNNSSTKISFETHNCRIYADKKKSCGNGIHSYQHLSYGKNLFLPDEMEESGIKYFFRHFFHFFRTKVDEITTRNIFSRTFIENPVLFQYFWLKSMTSPKIQDFPGLSEFTQDFPAPVRTMFFLYRKRGFSIHPCIFYRDAELQYLNKLF